MISFCFSLSLSLSHVFFHLFFLTRTLKEPRMLLPSSVEFFSVEFFSAGTPLFAVGFFVVGTPLIPVGFFAVRTVLILTHLLSDLKRVFFQFAATPPK